MPKQHSQFPVSLNAQDEIVKHGQAARQPRVSNSSQRDIALHYLLQVLTHLRRHHSQGAAVDRYAVTHLLQGKTSGYRRLVKLKNI
ncbi:MAG: hypothetical protein ACI30K_02520 [Muribaculaceae bacterium]